MPSRYLFCVVDDWELRGNGTGNVADLQHAPLRFYLDMSRQVDFPVTFMVEILQQIRFREHPEEPVIAAQSELWENCIDLMLKAGHDVQAHLHPQWWNARYEDARFRLSGSWNIATYPAALIAEKISESFGYLAGVARRVRPDHHICAFKAGTWALQPSDVILPLLEEQGVRLVMGPSPGIHFNINGFRADYSRMAEPLRPYHPDYHDIEQLAPAAGAMVVVPLPYYRRGLWGTLRRGMEYVSELVFGRPSKVSKSAIAGSPLAPVLDRRVLEALGDSVQQTRIFDIAGESFAEMRFAFNQIMRRFDALPGDAPIPVLLQSHSKSFPGNYEAVRAFFTYARERYHDSEWLTLSALADRIAATMPKSLA